MKKYILLALLVSSMSVSAQSIKDLLYSGKLKTDSGTVIKKGDDLTSKIDTTTKKPVLVENAKVRPIARDSALAGTNIPAGGVNAPINSPGMSDVSPTNSAVIPKDNNRIWKEYIDSFTSTLKTEVLTSSKIKSGSYYILVEYEIGPDGQTAITNVTCSPESSFLEKQVKERLTVSTPPMNPVLANGKPRKVTKKYNLTVTKP